jgi:nucleoside-diphosphate-sugar epimerase
MGERVLVTGATGFIGSHLVEKLINLGYGVSVLVRKDSNLRWLQEKHVQYIYGDFAETGGIPTLNGIDYIFHLGGATRAIRQKDFYRINFEGTVALLNAAQDIKGLKGFIFLSSQAAAGPSQNDRASLESDIPHPVSPYGKSKLRAEKAVLSFKDRFHVTILRPCGVYGPRDGYMLELFRQISKGFIPSIGKGPMYWNLCYVDDIVHALLLSIKQDRPSGEIFFITDGERYSFDYFAEVVSSSLQIKPRRVVIPSWAAWCYATAADIVAIAAGRPAVFSRNKCAEGCCKNWVCDISKAKKELGFRPGVLLGSGVNATLNWYKEQGWL